MGISKKKLRMGSHKNADSYIHFFIESTEFLLKSCAKSKRIGNNSVRDYRILSIKKILLLTQDLNIKMPSPHEAKVSSECRKANQRRRQFSANQIKARG